jgi:vacuolar-type H+-ATPase subunit I/STV1
MFGDIGHGFMMAMAGYLLVKYEDKLKYLADDEMFGTVYKVSVCLSVCLFVCAVQCSAVQCQDRWIAFACFDKRVCV